MDFNQVILLGRVDSGVECFTTQGGVELASFTLATSTGWKDKQTGEWKKNVQWHHVTTYQPLFVSLLRSRCKKGMRVFIQAQMSYRAYRRPGEATPRVSADVKIGPGDTLIFLDTDGKEVDIDQITKLSDIVSVAPISEPMGSLVRE